MDNIQALIPQRPPIIMVDELTEADEEQALCQLTVRKDNFFLQSDGTMAETGIIEHIAQSASAYAGHKALQGGAKVPPVGYIGEIKNFHLYQLPQVGDQLQTTIVMGPEAQGVTLLHGETLRNGKELVAKTQMKIFIAQE